MQSNLPQLCSRPKVFHIRQDMQIDTIFVKLTVNTIHVQAALATFPNIKLQNMKDVIDVQIEIWTTMEVWQTMNRFMKSPSLQLFLALPTSITLESEVVCLGTNSLDLQCRLKTGVNTSLKTDPLTPQCPTFHHRPELANSCNSLNCLFQHKTFRDRS